MILESLFASVFIALCLGVIYYDLRHMRIPDTLSVGFICLFVASFFVFWPDIAAVVRLLTATSVFAICFVLFALRIMGGGDTKVIPAMSLFVPFESLSGALILFSICLLGSILIVLMARSWVKNPPNGWAIFESKKLPMGLAIGSTGIIAECVRLTS